MFVCIVVVAIQFVINTLSDMYVHMDLGLWILHSALGQPSKKVTVGRM
jgi:hypothetical protein